MTQNFWNLRRPETGPADVHVPRTIAESATTTSRLMEMLDINAHGNVHGGVIMRMIDESAAIVAIKHSRRPVVTARVDQLNFLAPAFIGDVITLHCSLDYVGHTSMEVNVDVKSESLRTGEIRDICCCRIIYVALDENRKPVQVPPLKPTNDEERIRIERAKARRHRLREMDKELQNLA